MLNYYVHTAVCMCPKAKTYSLEAGHVCSGRSGANLRCITQPARVFASGKTNKATPYIIPLSIIFEGRSAERGCNFCWLAREFWYHSCCLVYTKRVKRAWGVRWGCGRAAFIDPGLGCSSLGVCDVRQQGWNQHTYTEQPGLLVH